MDIDEVKRIPISEVVGRDVRLEKRGKHDYWGLSPFTNEKSPSFHCLDDRGFYHCFSTGKNGDVIDYIMETRGCHFKEAVRILGGDVKDGGLSVSKTAPSSFDPYEGYTPIIPVPESAGIIAKGKPVQLHNPKRVDDEPKRANPKWAPDMVFPYRDATGALMGYVLRKDSRDGGKITPVVLWCQKPDGSEGWCYHPWPEPRPIYGLDRMVDKNQVIWCEGEKSADALWRMSGKPGIATSGGGKAISKSDFSPLKGKKLVIWPDADKPGEEAEAIVASMALAAGVIEVKTIGWDRDKAYGWDAADAEQEHWTREQVLSWVKSRAKIWNPTSMDPGPDREEPPPPVSEDDYGPMPPTEGAPPIEPNDDEPHQADQTPFEYLGYDESIAYYLPDGTGQIVGIPMAAHGKNTLLQLAPLRWWEASFPCKAGADWLMAADAMIRNTERRRVYDPSRIRGRGAWMDDGRVAIHRGNEVTIDNTTYPASLAPSAFVYSVARTLTGEDGATALKTKEAHQFIDICEALSWETPLSGKLLAGWCVIAPVCGALDWRPHIWITGASGSGKTTVVQQIVKPMLGEWPIVAEGATTEAGLRQQVGRDARPILMDEAEAEDERAAMRMKSILDMARVSSSGGVITKGTQNGRSMHFTARSAFCFASINPSVSHFADESRISSLILERDDSPDSFERFAILQENIHKTITPAFAAGMFARAVENIRTVRTNIATFADAGAKILGDRRVADQIAPMLAGAYLCHSTNIVTMETAEAWIGDKDWTRHTTVDEVRDEDRCLIALMGKKLRIETGHGARSATIGELVQIMGSFVADPIVSTDIADRELSNIGIKVERFNDEVLFANSAPALTELLRGTPWAASWRKALLRLKGSLRLGTRRFNGYLVSRATSIPLSLVIEKSDDPDPVGDDEERLI